MKDKAVLVRANYGHVEVRLKEIMDARGISRNQLAKRIDAAMLLKVGKRALALPPPVIVSRIRKLMRLVGIDNHQLRIAEPDRHIAIRQ